MSRWRRGAMCVHAWLRQAERTRPMADCLAPGYSPDARKPEPGARGPGRIMKDSELRAALDEIRAALRDLASRVASLEAAGSPMPAPA